MSAYRRNQIQEGALPSEGANDSYGSAILAVCWLVEVISTIFIGLRVYCKMRRSKHLWWDDYVLLAAWSFQSVDMVLITTNVALGDGQHVYNVDPKYLPTIALLGNISGTFSIIAAFLSKTSFGITLLRLTNGYLSIFVWVAIITMDIALGLSALFIWIQCDPPAKNWHPELPGTCWDPSFMAKYGAFSGAYSAAMDILFSLLPWTILWSLQMHTREKVGVALAMSMGIFAGGTAIAKVIQLPRLANGDFTYYESQVVIWGTVETAVTIMAASVPFLRVLVIEVRGSSFRRSGDGKEANPSQISPTTPRNFSRPVKRLQIGEP
ncbi:hypothetical protein GQ53DRAFT_637744 [Thozetella sp. PMI_491]|nr:hypothetical protein GQ53DRAFT_637744 [Thozetella sp. PMI_491]